MNYFKRSFLFLFMLMPYLLQAQSKEIKAKFNDYTDNEIYKISNDNLVVTEVIDDIPGSKEDIYLRVKNYFSRAYRDGNSVIQTEDKEGGIVIGKGYYKKFWKCGYMGLQNIEWNAYHVLRVDIKDSRIRVMCSADVMDYKMTGNAMAETNEDFTYPIVAYAPFTDKRQIDKGKQMEAVVRLIEKMQDTISNLKKAVKEGGVIEGENEEW